MAKIKAYKLVNVGALEASPFSTVRASAAPIQSINTFGKTFTSIGNVFNDMHSIAKGTLAAYADIEKDQRRELRRQRDAAAEARQEAAARKNKSTRKKVTKKKGKKLGIGDLFMKKLTEGLTKIFAPIFAPLTGWFGMIIGVLAARGAFDILTDEEKRKKFVETFEKAKCVFGKIFGFIKDRVMNVWDGWKKLTGEDSSFIDRLTGLGEVLTGIAGLLLAFNPLGILGFLFDTLAGIGADAPDATKKPKGDDPDGKPRTTTPDADDLGPDGKPRTTTPDRPRNGLQRFLDDRIQDATNLKNRLLQAAQAKWGLVDDWAKKQYANLSEGIRKQWENLTTLGSKLKNRSMAIGSAIGQKVGDAKKFAQNGINSLGEKAKNAVMQKIVEPFGKLLEPITSKLKTMAGKVMEPIANSPLGKKVVEALKKKGINGFSDIGGIAKRVGGKALPIIGGLVNLIFAYDRLANKDPLGALFEFLSGAFDISGLFPPMAAIGPPISMGIDAYMFARDLIPGIQQFEQGIIDKIPGANWVMDKIKKIDFPPLGAIVSAITGKKEEPIPGENAGDKLPEKASGGGLSARQRSRRGGSHSRTTPVTPTQAPAGGIKKGIVSLYSGHADMAEGAKGGRGTAGGRIVGGKYSSGLEGAPGGWVPAAASAGYLSNEAYFNDMIAKKAAAKSGGVAMYRAPIRTVSGSDSKSNWSRIDRDNAAGITTIEIHQDAPPNMGRPGTMGIGPSMASRGAKNSILNAVNNAYGIHTAQRGLGAVNPNNLSTLLEIDALKMEYLKNPGSFIERESTKLANAIKAGAAKYDASKVGTVEDIGGGWSGGADVAASADDASMESGNVVENVVKAIVDPREALKNLVTGIFGKDVTAEPENQAAADKLGPALGEDVTQFYTMSKTVSLDKDFFEMTDAVPFVIDRAVPVFTAVPINTDSKLIFGTPSSLLDKAK